MPAQRLALPLLLLAALAAAGLQPAPARERGGDQDIARAGRNAGQLKSLPEIESRVVPRMGDARYIGPEFSDGRYRLKFLRGQSVIWVDVDGRTGEIIGRTGQ